MSREEGRRGPRQYLRELDKSVKNVTVLWAVILTVSAMCACVIVLPDPWGLIAFLIPFGVALLVLLGYLTKVVWDDGKS